MENFPTKVDGISTLPAAEYNNLTSELKNAVTTSGQSLDTLKTNQLALAMSIYASSGVGYVDSGAVNAYILTPLSPKLAPPSYSLQMSVRFIALNSNTGASTINVDGLGVKNIKDADGNDLIAGEISIGKIIELVYNGTNFILFNTGIAGEELSTGDMTPTMKDTSNAGWLLMDDGTIGSTASSANHKSDQYINLFKLIWNNTIDADCPVVDGRLGSADLDWAANKAITLPRTKGRVLGGAGTGAGLTARRLGQPFSDEEDHQITEAELAAHTHAYNERPYGSYGAGGTLELHTSVNTASTTGSTGGNVAHNNMQPTLFVNWMIKI